MADTQVLGTCEVKLLEVQVLSPAQFAFNFYSFNPIILMEVPAKGGLTDSIYSHSARKLSVEQVLSPNKLQQDNNNTLCAIFF